MKCIGATYDPYEILFIRRVELGQRFVTDIELVMLSDVLQVSIEELLSGK